MYICKYLLHTLTNFKVLILNVYNILAMQLSPFAYQMSISIAKYLEINDKGIITIKTCKKTSNIHNFQTKCCMCIFAGVRLFLHILLYSYQ